MIGTVVDEPVMKELHPFRFVVCSCTIAGSLRAALDRATCLADLLPHEFRAYASLRLDSLREIAAPMLAQRNLWLRERLIRHIVQCGCAWMASSATW